MQNIILSPIPLEQFRTEISACVQKEFQIFLLNLAPQTAPTEYLNRKEAANLLSISLPTLNEWTKSGLVQGYRIATRVRYKRAELETSLKQIKTRRAK